MRIALAARTSVPAQVVAAARTGEEPGWIARHLSVALARGEPVTVEKIVSLRTSRDRATCACGESARGAAARAPSYDELRERHVLAWDHLWRRARLDVGRTTAQRTVNLHMFHLLQTLSPHTIGLDVGVPARGLHGEAYRGHVFWDELFVLPFSACVSRTSYGPCCCTASVGCRPRGRRRGRPATRARCSPGADGSGTAAGTVRRPGNAG